MSSQTLCPFDLGLPIPGECAPECEHYKEGVCLVMPETSGPSDEQIAQFFKRELSLELDVTEEFGPASRLRVRLSLGETEIASEYVDLPDEIG